MVGCSVGLSVIISLKVKKLHFHAQIGAIVFSLAEVVRSQVRRHRSLLASRPTPITPPLRPSTASLRQAARDTRQGIVFSTIYIGMDFL